jgi:hypothetical protein
MEVLLADCIRSAYVVDRFYYDHSGSMVPSKKNMRQLDEALSCLYIQANLLQLKRMVVYNKSFLLDVLADLTGIMLALFFTKSCT